MIKKHPLASFFALAFGISWLIEIPLALQAQGFIPKIFPFSMHYLSGYGPMIAAFLVTGQNAEEGGLKNLLKRITKVRLYVIWWVIAISPLLLYFLINISLSLFQLPKYDLIMMGEVDFLPPLGLMAVPLWIFTFGIGEETGWRGFALPRLQKGRSALSATLILWAFWALWHMPLFFYSYDPSIIPGMLTGLLAGAITFTWLYNSTHGSVLMTAIWHGLFNLTTACISCKTGSIAAVISALVMIWAIVVVIWFKPKNLSSVEKQTI